LTKVIIYHGRSECDFTFSIVQSFIPLTLNIYPDSRKNNYKPILYLMKGFHFFSFIIAVFILNSCYSDDVNMPVDAHHSAVYSNDSSFIYFAGHAYVWQAAKGLYAMPDGGRYRVLYKNTSLYSYEVENQKIKSLFDCGNCPII